MGDSLEPSCRGHHPDLAPVGSRRVEPAEGLEDAEGSVGRFDPPLTALTDIDTAPAPVYARSHIRSLISVKGGTPYAETRDRSGSVDAPEKDATAGACVGCPYQGKYCPALFGVYLGNFLSGILYKDRKFDEKFFKRNAAAGETMVLVLVLFPLYWVFITGWYLVLIYLALIAAHLVIFMPTQCEKCSYNTTCPGGLTWRSCRKWFGFKDFVSLDEG